MFLCCGVLVFLYFDGGMGMVAVFLYLGIFFIVFEVV